MLEPIDVQPGNGAELPQAIVGLGTLLAPSDVDLAVELGVHFIVSPGTTPALLAAARQSALPFLPGIATASEAMAARAAGFTLLKFFPAEAAGSIAWLKGIAGPRLLNMKSACPAMMSCMAGAPPR